MPDSAQTLVAAAGLTLARVMQAYLLLKPLNAEVLADMLDRAKLPNAVDAELLEQSIRLLRAASAYVTEIDDIRAVFKTMGVG